VVVGEVVVVVVDVDVLAVVVVVVDVEEEDVDSDDVVAADVVLSAPGTQTTIKTLAISILPLKNE